MARRRKAEGSDRDRVRALLSYRDAPSVELEWVALEAWSVARIVRLPPAGCMGSALEAWRAGHVARDGFTPHHHWLAVPDGESEAGQGWVRKDKLEAICALKPGGLLELVRPSGELPYLRVTWQAATGRKGWLSLRLERPVVAEVVYVDARASSAARAKARAERLAALEAEGQADDDGQDLESEAA